MLLDMIILKSYDSIWYDMIWHDIVFYHKTHKHILWRDIIEFDTTLYMWWDMIIYHDVIWYDIRYTVRRNDLLWNDAP